MENRFAHRPQLTLVLGHEISLLILVDFCFEFSEDISKDLQGGFKGKIPRP